LIVPCPECNGKVSSTVPACPHCGYVMNPTAADPLEDPERVVACPYCAEPIQVQATICPHCRGPVSQGRAVHPAHMRKPARPAPPSKSFTSLAWICALLYLLCWPIGLVLNLMWFNEACHLEEQTGREPDGKGCLSATLVVGAGLVILIVIGILSR
jgi:double zinc ribbon protein